MLPRRGMISQPALPPPFKAGKYRHYKGGEYQALSLACHEETHEWFVVYRPLYDYGDAPGTWIRTYDNFFSLVAVDDVSVPRFTHITDEVVDAG